MTYLRNVWYVAAWSSEVASGALVARTILDEPIVFFRRADGSIAALHDQCPHRFAPLSAGVPGENTVACRYHGLAFDGAGACVHNPHGPTSAALAVKSYTVHEAHRAVWIWMGDASKADPASIPDFSFLSKAPDTAFNAGELISGKGNYEIYVDNILDLSHTDYLHPTTLGGGGFTASAQEIKESDDYFDVTWYMRDQPPPPMPAKLLGPLMPPRTDVFSRVRWFAPGIMKLTGAIMAAGAEEDTAILNENALLFTPETGRTTHYFFAATRNYHVENAMLNEKIAGMRKHVFATEDGPMVEAVDRRMGGKDFWSMRPRLFSIDGASVKARRRLQALIAAEQGATAPASAVEAAE